MKKSIFLLISALLIFPCVASPSTGKVTFTTETLSDYYVWVENTKISIDGYVTSDSGEIGFTLDKYSLPKQLADYAGTYVYTPETREMRFFAQAGGYGFDGRESILVEGDLIFRFSRRPNHLDVYNMKTDSYLYSGYEGTVDQKTGTIEISLLKPLFPEDTESARTAHEEKLKTVPEQHRMSAVPAYRYRIHYKTGETTFIGGDLLFFWE